MPGRCLWLVWEIPAPILRWNSHALTPPSSPEKRQATSQLPSTRFSLGTWRFAWSESSHQPPRPFREHADRPQGPAQASTSRHQPDPCKPDDLEAAGCQRVPKTVGVLDGRPLLEDGRTLDVRMSSGAPGIGTAFHGSICQFSTDSAIPAMSKEWCRASGTLLVGLHFLSAMSSASLVGVGRDAKRSCVTWHREAAAFKRSANLARGPVRGTASMPRIVRKRWKSIRCARKPRYGTACARARTRWPRCATRDRAW